PRVWSWLRRPALQSAAVLLAGTGLLGWQGYRLDQAEAKDLAESDAHVAAIDRVGSPAASGGHAMTDAGREVPLFVPAHEGATLPEETELHHPLGRYLNRKVIQTAPADPSYNCHGWVFAGARFRMNGEAIELILQ